MQITNSCNSQVKSWKTERHLWHSLKCQTSVCWMAFTHDNLPQFYFCIWQTVSQTQTNLFLPACMQMYISYPLYVAYFYLFCIHWMIPKYLQCWIFSSKVWACFHSAHQNHLFLRIKVSASLEKYNGYHLHGYHKEYIHNELKHRSTDQILLITLTKMM